MVSDDNVENLRYFLLQDDKKNSIKKKKILFSKKKIYISCYFILSTRQNKNDTKTNLRRGGVIIGSSRLFKLYLKLVLFKKSNGMMERVGRYGKILISPSLVIYIFYYIKINTFYKNKIL